MEEFCKDVDKIYACNQCKVTSISQKIFWNHIRGSHSFVEDLDRKQSFRCSFCRHVFQEELVSVKNGVIKKTFNIQPCEKHVVIESKNGSFGTNHISDPELRCPFHGNSDGKSLIVPGYSTCQTCDSHGNHSTREYEFQFGRSSSSSSREFSDGFPTNYLNSNSFNSYETPETDRSFPSNANSVYTGQLREVASGYRCLSEDSSFHSNATDESYGVSKVGLFQKYNTHENYLTHARQLQLRGLSIRADGRGFSDSFPTINDSNLTNFNSDQQPETDRRSLSQDHVTSTDQFKGDVSDHGCFKEDSLKRHKLRLEPIALNRSEESDKVTSNSSSDSRTQKLCQEDSPESKRKLQAFAAGSSPSKNKSLYNENPELQQQNALTFSSGNTFNRHQENFHEDNPEDRKQSEWRCEECDYVFTTKGYLSRHQRKFHKDNLEVRKKFPWRCKICDEIFWSETFLWKHKLLRHSDHEDNTEDRQQSEWRCEVCDHVFTAYRNLTGHQKHFHKGNPEVRQKFPWTCEICHEIFTSAKWLIQHKVSRHKGEQST